MQLHGPWQPALPTAARSPARCHLPRARATRSLLPPSLRCRAAPPVSLVQPMQSHSLESAGPARTDAQAMRPRGRAGTHRPDCGYRVAAPRTQWPAPSAKGFPRMRQKLCNRSRMPRTDPSQQSGTSDLAHDLQKPQTVPVTAQKTNAPNLPKFNATMFSKKSGLATTGFGKAKTCAREVVPPIQTGLLP